MSYTRCPTVAINTPVGVVWALLTQPAGWGSVFDLRVRQISPPGPATVGQQIKAETGSRFFRLSLTFRIVEVDKSDHRLWLDVELRFGITAFEDLRCTPLDANRCKVDYRCRFANKTILFVAEKQAALEVVKRRLEKAGIGEFCLELHSDKA